MQARANYSILTSPKIVETNASRLHALCTSGESSRRDSEGPSELKIIRAILAGGFADSRARNGCCIHGGCRANLCRDPK